MLYLLRCDTKPVVEADTTDGCAAIQRDGEMGRQEPPQVSYKEMQSHACGKE